MVRRRHDDVGMRRERFVERVHFQRRAHHHGDVGQVVGQLTQKLFAVVHGQVQFHAGIAAREFNQQAREKVVAGADHGDVQFAAGNAFELRQRFLGFLELLDDGAAVVQQFGAARREEDFLAELLKQGQSDVAFQRLDLDRYRRLGQMQFLGRARVAQMAGDGLENLQLAQGGVLHGISLIALVMTNDYA